MKLVKALVLLNMARSGAEANRLVKQGSVWFGGCIAPCNPRISPFNSCTCNGWGKSTNPVEEVKPGQVIRIKDGSLRLLTREDGKQGFDQIPGIGRVPESVGTKVLLVQSDKLGRIEEWHGPTTERYTIERIDETWENVDGSHFLVLR